MTSRLLGMNTDAVIEFRVVDANGEVLVANGSNEYSDLFWGLRGGSGINLGIVTSILFQGKKMPKQILGGHLSFDMTADAAEALAGTMYDLIWGAGDPENMRPFGFSIGWVPSDDDPNGAFSFVSSFCWFIVFSCCCRARLDQLVAMNRSHSSHRLTSFICTLPLLFLQEGQI